MPISGAALLPGGDALRIKLSGVPSAFLRGYAGGSATAAISAYFASKNAYGVVDFAGSASGGVQVSGIGAGEVAFSGQAQVSVFVTASSDGLIDIAGDSQASALLNAQALGQIALAGEASGTAQAALSPITASASGVLQLSGASGSAFFVKTKPSGATQFYMGRSAPVTSPAWAQTLSANTIAPIEATTWFSRATSLLGAESQWPGTASIRSIVDAFGDPVLHKNKIYFNGGGHNDGFCNTVLVYDPVTLSMSVAVEPTPGSCYPPGFPNAAWPSGRGVDWMRTAAQHDPLDVAYAAPFSAPRLTHRYGGQAARTKAGVPQEIIWFYAQATKFNITNSTWTNMHELGQDYIIQRVADRADIVSPGLGFNIGRTTTLQQGTMALYDEVTDRFYVTLIPGDGGGGWRTFFFCWNPNTDTVPSIHMPPIPCRESMTFLQAGRYIFGITSPYSVAYPNYEHRVGFRFNIDSQTFDYFEITGNFAAFTAAAGETWGQEAVPYLHDKTRNTLVGWSHNQADRGNLYELPLASFGTHGGAGTLADPFLWPQAKIALSGTPPSQVSYKYNGFWHIPEWGVYLVFPHSNTPPYAIKR